MSQGEGKIELVFITSNEHKIKEAMEILNKWNIELVGSSIPKIEIQDDCIERISRYAAIQAYNVIKKPVIVEDSGLFIESLNGFPGPYSSYVYRKIGNEGIVKLMGNINDRRAYFKASLTCVCDQYVKTFNGIVHGKISDEPRGYEGFGFDPIFIPEGYDKTIAELGEHIKNNISHRYKAFTQLAEWISRQKSLKP
jgi:XTP/dITP diphosphohydrolase